MLDWLRRRPGEASQPAPTPPMVTIGQQRLPLVIRRMAQATRMTLRLAPDGSEVRLSMPRWGRTNDTLALAGVINGISSAHQQYFAAGGLGILIGDGQLPHYGSEGILETYYDFAVAKALHVSFDYQFITNPGYNRDRGPVSIFAARIHAQF